MDRETEKVKIGEYEFHFWKKAKGKEVFAIMRIMMKADSYDERGMLNAVMDNFQSLASLLCAKVTKSEQEVGIEVADDFEADDYLEFFNTIAERTTKVVEGMNKKKEKK